MLGSTKEHSESEETISTNETIYLSENSCSTDDLIQVKVNSSHPTQSQPPASKRKCHKFRNFWAQELYKRLACDARGDFFLRLFGSNKFSWEFFQSLHLLFEELNIPTHLIDNFHHAIIDIFSKFPEIQQTFPKYMGKFQDWCTRPSQYKRYRGKFYELYKCKLQIFKESVAIPNEKFQHPEEIPIKKKIKPDTEVNIEHINENALAIDSLKQEIHKRDSIIISLLYNNSHLIGMQPAIWNKINGIPSQHPFFLNPSNTTT
jgi:hypothetical protein